jgi:hypothetical protein
MMRTESIVEKILQRHFKLHLLLRGMECQRNMTRYGTQNICITRPTSRGISREANTDIFVPAGYQGQPTRPSPTARVVLINYAHLGNLNNVTLAIYHVGNFGVQPAGDRVRIGTTGGPGGADSGDFHSHFELWNGRYKDVVDGPERFARRVYPFTSVFCP